MDWNKKDPRSHVHRLAETFDVPAFTLSVLHDETLTGAVGGGRLPDDAFRVTRGPKAFVRTPIGRAQFPFSRPRGTTRVSGPFRISS